MIVVAFIVTVSIKWVGILIINALLVLPAAAARNVSGGMRSYHGLSILFSLFSGVSGFDPFLLFGYLCRRDDLFGSGGAVFPYLCGKSDQARG